MADWRFAAPFIIHKEGGLSRATTDTASKYPAPCTYNGLDGWHTNKGITWTTFKRLAPRVGYTVSCDLFFEMPGNVWDGIFKKGYWDVLAADRLKSNVIATYAVSWIWGGGGLPEIRAFLRANGYTVSDVNSIVNALNHWTARDEKQLFEKLLEWRAGYFKRLNQPANLKGWLNRLNLYRQRLSPYLGQTGTGKTLIALVAVGLFFFALYLLWPYRDKLLKSIKNTFKR